MPAPQWIRERALKARQRTCVICGTEFVVKKSSHAGKTCSVPCRKKLMSQNAKARRASPEQRAKLSLTMKEKYKDPAYAKRHKDATRSAQKKWHADPENAAAFAKRSSDRMKQRHADPEWQKVRNERSSRVMKENWEKYRDTFTQHSAERYQQMLKTGSGLLSEEAEERKRAAAKWIMKRANDALHEETDYNEVYARVQARIRAEQPFDGEGDYYTYCRWLGREVVNSPECRQVADEYMSEAIPRFSALWRERKAA